MTTLAERAREHHLAWIVVGDRKGPTEFELPPAEFVSIDEQAELPFELARLLPEKHYARKNIGYLLAMARDVECIYETDDDNAPLPGWQPRPLGVEARRVLRKSDEPWINIYEAYSSDHIWPRGLPIDRVRQRLRDHFHLSKTTVRQSAPIQQGLANGSPDVDAVWRLVLDHEVTFDDGPNLLLPSGVWCPFNSQNTWWWRPVFPLLYLPSHCSFRMTDIWRSFIAQRCLWELGFEVEFHAADVQQERNEHNLLRDFDDETVGYLRNDDIRRLLEAAPLRRGVDQLLLNIERCYEVLARESVVGPEEPALVRAWLDDCATLLGTDTEATIANATESP
jgi:hypothetical protein